MNYIDQNLPEKGDTVVVGMSGGVDSTLTALLMLNKGCRVIGVTMSLWDGSIPELKSEKSVREACYGPGEEENIAECQKFCAEHGIDYHVIDVKNEYKERVLEYFKTEYRSGRTPNPCIFCNRHYAKIVRPETGLYGTDKRPFMISGALDVSKDQTYFLYRVPSKILEKVRFPLAFTKKSEVFRLAEEANLDAAKRKESQDFIGEEYFDLLFADKPSVPGDIIDLDGHVLGKHRGIEHYTVGQRRGLGVALSYPVYVHSIDAKNNVVVLAPNDALDSDGLIADNFVWPGDIEPDSSFRANVKIRLASKPVPAVIEKFVPENPENFTGSVWRITFDEPQRAITKGQAAVLYDGDTVVGGGTIE